MRDAILEPIVREDGRVELAREGEDEVVRIRTGRRLLDLARLHERFVAVRVIDLMTQCGVGDEDRRKPVLGQPVADQSHIR